MNIIETEVKDVYIIEPQMFGDNRGWFMESWSEKRWRMLDFLTVSYRTTIYFLRRRGHCGDSAFKKAMRHRQSW